MTTMIKTLLAAALVSAALATAAPVTALSFGQNLPPIKKASVYSILMVVVTPRLIFDHSLEPVSNASSRQRISSVEGKARQLPPMAVQQVEAQDDGGFQVTLQHPEHSDQRALVQWPARVDNPAATLKVGDVLNFMPTDAGAGWTVHAADGAALAFMPTPDAAALQSSERW